MKTTKIAAAFAATLTLGIALGAGMGQVSQPEHPTNKRLHTRMEVIGDNMKNTVAQAKGAPSSEAYLTFHATSHLLQAVNLAGPDRDAIRAMLVKLRDVWLGVLEDGQWRSFSVPVR